MVFEYLDGEHLGRRIARRPLTLAEAVRVLVPVGHALSAAHVKAIVHRDLKPENIFLCRSGTVKVVDFGVAKLAGAEGLTAFNTTVGTVPYMSPEQIMGGEVDGRTDQFALGAILYEMLTGQSCFAGPESLPDQAVRVIRHQPTAPPGLAPGVWAIIERALSKSADQRFVEVAQFVEALLLAVGELTPGEARAQAELVAAPAPEEEGLPPLDGDPHADVDAAAAHDGPGGAPRCCRRPIRWRAARSRSPVNCGCTRRGCAIRVCCWARAWGSA